MEAIWALLLALHFSLSEGNLLDIKISSVTNRYDVAKMECSTIQLEENLMYTDRVTVNECATLCDEYAECQSFQWNRITRLCQTYNTACLKHLSVNSTYSFTKRERTGNLDR